MKMITKARPLNQYKYLTFLTMLFITIFLICDTTAFRMVPYFGDEIPLSGLIIPIVFAIGDIIAETYGYKITMKVLMSGIICQFLFGLILTLALMAPSQPSNLVNVHYDLAFQHLFRTSVTSCCSVTAGMFANAFLISKLKVYMNGKRFWLRTLISSSFSEIVLCAVAYFCLFSGLKDVPSIIKIIFMVWTYKVVISILINPIVTFAGRTLKHLENSDVYDYGISYNPFKNDKPIKFRFKQSTKDLSNNTISNDLVM